MTHTRIYRPPTPLAAAIDQVDAWMESPGLTLLGESTGYWGALRTTLQASLTSGPKIHDARVATLCTATGVARLWSCDRAFSRFRDLRVVNPPGPAAPTES